MKRIVLILAAVVLAAVLLGNIAFIIERETSPLPIAPQTGSTTGAEQTGAAANGVTESCDTETAAPEGTAGTTATTEQKSSLPPAEKPTESQKPTSSPAQGTQSAPEETTTGSTNGTEKEDGVLENETPVN